MPRRSRISWNSLDEAVPPSITSSSESANRSSSARASPGPQTETWNCSVSFSWNRTTRKETAGRRGMRQPGSAPATGRSARTRARTGRRDRHCRPPPARSRDLRRQRGGTRRRSRSAPIRSPSARRGSGGRADRPRRTSQAWRGRAPHRADASSTIAISSSTTSRSCSISLQDGERSMSVMTSSASGRWSSRTRAYSRVESLAVAALSSAPSSSNSSAIAVASWRAPPLNSRCSMKCASPRWSGRSSREPASIQKPTETERSPSMCSEATRRPPGSVVTRCIGAW